MNDKTITLTVTLAEVNALIAGLGKLPLEAVIELFAKVKNQAEEQIAVTE